ncbi:MAG: hypothetical protein Q7Q71_00950 [Verrucomicrobiota bacterium JB023]|nr:hypothetical protein [Verrucomicrobiota bacterium JB023]
MNAALWERLQSFQFDEDNSRLRFSHRLARENSWDHPFACRVVEEYRRFLYLACASGHPVTPSDEVDQAWHLHLVYTRSYWDELCTQTLGRPIHHGPTKGGREESSKFHDWYARTLDSYREHFGEEPPVDIWPPASVRFERKYRRIDESENFVIRKRTLYLMGGATAASLALASCSDGAAFGIFFGILIILALSIFALLPSSSRRSKRSNRSQSGNGCGSATGHGGFLSSSDDETSSSDGGHDSGCGSGCGGGCGGD